MKTKMLRGARGSSGKVWTTRTRKCLEDFSEYFNIKSALWRLSRQYKLSCCAGWNFTEHSVAQALGLREKHFFLCDILSESLHGMLRTTRVVCDYAAEVFIWFDDEH